MCILKFGSLLCVDCEILNMEFFFHKQYEIFIPKTPNSHGAIELKPKRMEYFTFPAPESIC